MEEFVKSIKGLGPVRLATMGGAALALLGFFFFIMTRMSSTEMVVLYSDLSPADMGAVTQGLDAIGANYQTTPDRTTIMAPRTRVGELRMKLAEEGLPSTGSVGGYELFDESQGFGTTQFMQNINRLRALEGELSRTVTTLEPIRQARIHLVLPKRELFSREEQPASASVLLQLRPGTTLTQEQVVAIQNIVGAAVPKLEPSQVSITDERGNLLASGMDADSELFMNRQAEEASRTYERRLETAIVQMLARTVGFENIIANVSAELDFDRVTTQTTSFDPDQQIAVSQVVQEASRESRDSEAAEAVTVANNLPGAEETVGGAMTSDTETSSTETTNFEIGRTVTNAVRATGTVERLSVAVLINGTYTVDEDGNRNFVPRSEAELDQIEQLVRTAVGFDDERGDQIAISSMQFAEAEFDMDQVDENLLFGFPRDDLLRTLETLVMAVVGVLVVLMVVRPLMMRVLNDAAAAREAQLEQERILAEQAEELPALPSPDDVEALVQGESAEMERMIDIQHIDGKVKESSLRKIGELVDKHPQESVAILRGWMYAQEG